eukprot:1160995-Amphidinium_carterae.1
MVGDHVCTLLNLGVLISLPPRAATFPASFVSSALPRSDGKRVLNPTPPVVPSTACMFLASDLPENYD